MIDIHNHVLPNIDDGSKSIEMSLNMLKCAHEQGITDVVNTVHFQHPLFLNIDHSLENFERITKSLQSKLDEYEIPIKIHLGSEVFYYENLLKISNEPLTTMGGGKYMLIEFSPKNIPNSQKQTLFDLKMSGITPIIAHPERYKLVQENFSIVYDWINAGCLIQVDSGSVLGLMGEKAKKSSHLIIQEMCCHVLASDAHNDSNRNFTIKEAYSYVKTVVGKKKADLMVYEHPSSIIRGEDLYF